MTTQSTSMLRLLRNKNFGLLWLAQTVSYVGDYFYFLAVPIIVNRLTGSTLQVGLSVITFSLPQLLGFVSGVFVDRWDRRITMIVADLLRAGLVLTCFLVKDASQLWIFYIGGFLISAISIFFNPAKDALVPLIVSEDELVAANGLNQVTRTAAFLIGPALAGFTIGLLGDTVAWVMDCASYVLSALLILGIARQAGRSPKQTEESVTVGAVWEELRSGLKYLFGSRLYIGIMGTFSVAMLGIGACNVLWVPMMQRYHGIGPEGLGLIDSMQGAGMAVGGIITGWIANRWRLNWQIGVTSIVIGVMVSLMGWSPIFWPILVFSFILGVALTPLNALLTTAMQRGAPDALRGRIMGGFNSVSGVSSLFSMAIAAMLGEIVSLRALWIACGVLVAAAGLLASRWLVEPAPYPTDPITVEQSEP